MSRYKQSEYNKQRHPEFALKRELRLRYIADAIVQGKSKRKVCQEFEEKWDISHNLMCDLYNEALATLTDEEGLAKLREVNTERLLDLYETACKTGDVKSQLKAIDLINRTNSIYKTNIDLGQDTEFVFNFGQEQ